MVNIYEQAIKPVVDLEDGVTVYVPGYSTIGPEEPTLCLSVSEFEGLFGSSPYLFEEDQAVGGISKGSPEKGYLYAKSLLSSGLRVLFHRFKKEGAKTAKADFEVKSETVLDNDSVVMRVKAYSFGKGYNGISVSFEKKDTNLYKVIIKRGDETILQEGLISFDPQSSLYLKFFKSNYIKFVQVVSGNETDIVDTVMESIAKAGDLTLTPSQNLTLTESFSGEEFNLEEFFEGLASNGTTNPMESLKDFEKYPSVAYLTTGGYYTDSEPDVAVAQLAYAEAISAIALVDRLLNINKSSDWVTAKGTLASINGTSGAKGKAAHFCGCNSFNLTPYRVVLADSFNYLKCLGENIKRGVAPWLPVANDPNGVSSLGYDTTQKISTQLAEEMAEGEIGVSSNPLIYSTSAGGYKIMGNRTLLYNNGVLSPNSFLNVSVIVNRVARSARQVANKLKIVSTNPDATFLKFKQSVAKTIEPMLVNQDGILEYKIKHLPKTAPATMNIQIHLVVLEGIEKFNIYIPYELKID